MSHLSKDRSIPIFTSSSLAVCALIPLCQQGLRLGCIWGCMRQQNSSCFYWAPGDEREQGVEDQILCLLPPSIPWKPGAEAPSGRSCWDLRETFSKPIGKIRKTLGFWFQPGLGRTPGTERSSYSSFLFPLCRLLSSYETFTHVVLANAGSMCVAGREG